MSNTLSPPPMFGGRFYFDLRFPFPPSPCSSFAAYNTIVPRIPWLLQTDTGVNFILLQKIIRPVPWTGGPPPRDRRQATFGLRPSPTTAGRAPSSTTLESPTLSWAMGSFSLGASYQDRAHAAFHCVVLPATLQATAALPTETSSTPPPTVPVVVRCRWYGRDLLRESRRLELTNFDDGPARPSVLA